MTRVATVRRLASPALAAVVAISLMTGAYAQQPASPPVTSDPSVRPDTPLPAYPPASRRKKEAGVVKMSFCVDAAGKVTKADLIQSSGFPNLDTAALKWAGNLALNPAKSGETPVAVCDVPFSYEFQVTKGKDQLMTRTTNPFDIGPATGLATGP